MKNRLYNNILIISIITTATITSSCSKMLDGDPTNVVAANKNYQSEADARAMVFGINGLHKKLLTDQYVLLGELRADLMDVTANADDYLRQISTHSVDASKPNPYIKPENFYQVILNCNDAMKNMKLMKANGKLDETSFNTNYTEVAAYRCWVYYLLAIQFGNVPYITEPIESIDAFNNAKYPIVPLNDMIDSLLNVMNTLSPSPLDPSVLSHSIWPGADGYSTSWSFVHRAMFMADLCLWKGNYEAAAFYYKAIMDFKPTNQLEDQYKEKCTSAYWSATAGSYPWGDIFIKIPNSRATSYEWMWVCYEDKQFDESNSLTDFFSPTYGRYLLKPSQYAINNWQNQVSANGQQGDKRGENASWKMENGNPVVYKYLNYSTPGVFNKDANLYIYRAGTLALRYAEAVNRMGYYKLALAVLGTSYSNISADPVANHRENNTLDFANDSMQNRPYYNLTIGPRGRAYLPPAVIPPLASTTLQDTIKAVEEIILNEYALEVAFEGERWSDYLRIANRREKEAPGTGATLLANGIAKKFEEANNIGEANAVRAKLMDPKNWFLPLPNK